MIVLLALASWVLTAITVSHVGIIYAASFTFATAGRLPAAWGHENFMLSLWYTVPVLLTLLIHEGGHMLACRRHKVKTGPAFAVPMPLGWLPFSLATFGTVGAFVPASGFNRLPSITRWDIASAGVLAGAAAAFVCTVAGYLMSVPAGPNPIHPWVPSMLVSGLVKWRPVEWHPLLVAGSVGWVLTAVSLLPLPGFDGGRMLKVERNTINQRPISAAFSMGVAASCWLVF